MDTEKKLERIEKDFLKTWIRRHPLMGSQLGFHAECDSQIPDGSLSKELEDARVLHRFLDAFERVDAKRLSPARAIDRELAIHRIRLWLFEREELRLWEAIPEAPQMIGHLIFQIISRNYAPLNHRIQAIMARLEKMPRYIEESKTKLRRPVKLFVENELETLTRLPGFFNSLKEVVRDQIFQTTQRELHRRLENLQNVLEGYSNWLIIDVLPECRSEYAIGGPLFRKLLERRGLALSPQGLLQWAQSEQRRLQEKLREHARQIKRKVPVDDVRELIKQQHPDSFDGVLRFVRESVQKARAFVVRSKFATIPEGDNLYVIETPSYLRHMLPFDAYCPPAKFESKFSGYFYVTPGDCDSDKLKEHHFSALTNMTVHDSYPGRHLQMSWATRHPSVIRVFADAAETVEGWAHYCEEHVKEMGYDDTPPSRFIATLELLWRAVRVEIDVALATEKMTVPQAVDYLIDTIGMDRVGAEAEVHRYAMTPTHPLSSLVGKEGIKELKKTAKEKMKNRFSETFFHDALLRSGGLPMFLLKKELDWKITQELEKPAVTEVPENKKNHSKRSKDAPNPSVSKKPRSAHALAQRR